MDHQGKRQDQLEFSYKVAFFSIVGIIITLILSAIFN